MELERRNCWTLAEALGHDGPYRLQHFLSRGSWNHGAFFNAAAFSVVSRVQVRFP